MELDYITQKITHFGKFRSDINPDKLLIRLICNDSLIIHFLYLRDHSIYGLCLEGIYNSAHVRMPARTNHSTVDLVGRKAIPEVGANGIKILID